jgi:Rieske Fe-S protein
VVATFVKKRFDFTHLEQLASLAHGEAMIASYEGQKVGIYKNEAGKIFAINPVCVHAGCIVSWNNAEKSWDCPCHGARYSYTGGVVNGPALHDLEQITYGEQEET